MTTLDYRIYVFYAGLVLLEFTNETEFKSWRRAVCHGDPEIYNGALAYYILDEYYKARPWYRLDGTPVLLEDVPKELRTLVLLLD